MTYAEVTCIGPPTNGTGGVYRANTDGSDVTIVISTKALDRRGVAYDWITGIIYYTDRYAHRIGLCKLASQLCTAVLRGEDGVVGEPIPIVLNTKLGRLFWGNRN